ncbi:bifunctional aspartate kinase/homoserine dehydrogenase I [Arenimonas sp.]|uniref:bifunctional aspartate kinase/homoserine dehydrogenase I n=1 Tax=Arenimonas sp. TaxID=1872635 RepID=UPI0039E539B3
MSSSPASSRSKPESPDRIAHKFGGSSLADADGFRRVAAILRERVGESQAIVASAMFGVTNSLSALAENAAQGRYDWQDEYAALRERHLTTAAQLLRDAGPLQDWLVSEFATLEVLLRALSALGIRSGEALERIQGLGEVWASRLLAEYLRQTGDACDWLDAREVLVVEHGDLGANVDWERSAESLRRWREGHAASRVAITGFVARTRDGRATTLGRNGSDYSGAIFASLFDASELHIWTDVDGLLSADPRLVPEAVPLTGLSYDEACELAYFGAKVIHPQTMTPAVARGLPILIRNTFRPAFPGTRIAAQSIDSGPVKGLTLASDLALLNVEGAGMIGVPGTAQRVFEALRVAGVSVVMISQGSSEHSICCVVRVAESVRAKSAVSEEFARELARGQIQDIALTDGISVLAAVGDGMAGTPGIAARVFEALARARVNVRAIAQGASERNISIAIASHEASRALRAVHAGFWLSPQTVSVGVIGPGKVGAALLDQLQEAMPRLRRDANIDLRLRALASSKRQWRDELGFAGDWRDAMQGASEDCDLAAFAAHVRTDHLPHAVILDCSASDAVAAHYADWLAAGIHVITPNKNAGAGDWGRYQAIRASAARSGARFRYEATVGAGLPIIQTLRDLLDTGDELLAVDGIFSGTLAWLFNRYDGAKPFSELVLEAKALGYTEPDPRDDLSGTDVARKLVILAREAGVALSLAEVQVESLVPAVLADASREEFLQRLGEADAAMRERHAAAKARGNVLRYVASLRPARDGASAQACVGLVELAADHAFAHLRLTDNVVQFSTRRYSENPLVVQGPGAGPEVTAAGVFADLLRVAANLGAKL